MSGYPPHVLYEQQLTSVALGTPLWNPIPDDGRVKIGDVGFMTHGSFIRLLRATASSEQLEELGDCTPAGFEELQLSPSGFLDPATRRPYPIFSTTMTCHGISGSASAGSVPVSEVAGGSINFEFSQGKCALFLTRYDSLCHNYIQNLTLKNYVKKHYISWMDLAKNRGYDDVRPMLVSGFDSSQDYAMMAYAASDNKLSASVTVNVPDFGSVWVNGWATCTIRGAPHYNYGPQSVESNNRRLDPSESAAQPVRSLQGTLAGFMTSLLLQSTESNNPRLQQELPAAQPAQNRCVTFVRGWHMEYRFFIFPTLKAAAEPKDLDREDPDPNAWAEVVSNVPSENMDPFAVVFKFLFQNSTANYALIHDDDLQQISKIAYHNNESIEDVLARCPPSVVLTDDDGVASIILERLGSWSDESIDAQRSTSTSEIINQTYLNSAFRSDDGFEELLKLTDEKAIAAINLIDSALSSYHLSYDLRRKHLAVLRKLCSKCLTLPKNRMLSQELVKIGDSPQASGEFTDLWKGEYREKRVAIKALRKHVVDGFLSKVKKQLFGEAAVWCHIRHENILPFIGIAAGSNFSQVYPWMIHGNVNEYLRIHPQARRLPLVKDILKGLEYLHFENIVHGNLKGANILINVDGWACLADFGLASFFGSRNIPWMAPELMDVEEFDFDKVTPTMESDIYAVGMVIYEIITGRSPWHLVFSHSRVKLNVIKGQRPQRPDDATFVKPLWPIAEMCWRQEPMKRPNSIQVLKYLEEEIQNWQMGDETEADDSDTEEDVDSETETYVSDYEEPAVSLGDTKLRKNKNPAGY